MDNPKQNEKIYTIVERTEAQKERDREIGEECKWDEYISKRLDRDRDNEGDDEEI